MSARHRMPRAAPRRRAPSGRGRHALILPARVRLPVLGNAVFVGLTTPALPLMLAETGESKGAIATFFVLNAASAAWLNLTVGPWIRRRGYPRWMVAACPAVCAIAVAVLGAGPDARWLVFLSGMAMMTISLVFPIHIGMATANARGSTASTIGSLRLLFVLGYLVGLGGYSVTTAAGQWWPQVTPVRAAAVLAAAIALVCAQKAPRTAPPNAAAATTDAATTATGTPARLPVDTVWLLATAAAVLLLRAADSLRIVYLPLYAQSVTVPETLIAALFAVTAAVELLVLAPLSRLCDRYGSGPTLIGVCVFGGASFLAVTAGSGGLVLVGSQILYAVFAAGFQSIGMVRLGEALPSGAAGGAALFTAVVQVGSTVGIVAPLVVTGFSAELFWIGAGFCALAAVLLLRRPARAAMPAQQAAMSPPRAAIPAPRAGRPTARAAIAAARVAVPTARAATTPVSARAPVLQSPSPRGISSDRNNTAGWHHPARGLGQRQLPHHPLPQHRAGRPRAGAAAGGRHR